jgi:H+/Cl- antiporter ClcA
VATEPEMQPPEQEEDRTVGELVLDVSERVSILVREEIELAKAEVSEKVSYLAKGSVVAIAAGIFVIFAIAMLMQFGAWLINDLLGVESAVWAGFGIMTILFLIIAAIAALIAQRAVQRGAPPAPTMAIEEAKVTRDTLEGQS